MERKLLDMMNQLSISEYNPRMKYCDKFQVCRTEYKDDPSAVWEDPHTADTYQPPIQTGMRFP
jgi:hypothetical protein